VMNLNAGSNNFCASNARERKHQCERTARARPHSSAGAESHFRQQGSASGVVCGCEAIMGQVTRAGCRRCCC
jgi:hypothetical protein